MMSGTAAATCLGAFLESSPRARRAQTFVVHWHLASVASSRCGTTPRRAAHETDEVTIVSTASSAAARTGAALSPARANRAGRAATAPASAEAPSARESSAAATAAPSLAPGLAPTAEPAATSCSNAATAPEAGTALAHLAAASRRASGARSAAVKAASGPEMAAAAAAGAASAGGATAMDAILSVAASTTAGVEAAAAAAVGVWGHIFLVFGGEEKEVEEKVGWELWRAEGGKRREGCFDLFGGGVQKVRRRRPVSVFFFEVEKSERRASSSVEGKAAAFASPKKALAIIEVAAQALALLLSLSPPGAAEKRPICRQIRGDGGREGLEHRSRGPARALFGLREEASKSLPLSLAAALTRDFLSSQERFFPLAGGGLVAGGFRSL